MTKFKGRWGFRHFLSHEESRGANIISVKAALRDLQEKLKAFAKKGIFNADECGFIYIMAPDCAIPTQALLDRKRKKKGLHV